VPRLRFGQDDVRFKFRGVRCGLPTIRKLRSIQCVTTPQRRVSIRKAR
jgi:hypothetical protein